MCQAALLGIDSFSGPVTAVLCDGSKRRATASQEVFPTRRVRLVIRPSFFISQLFLVSDNHYGGRTLVRCPGVAAVTFFSSGSVLSLEGRVQGKEITLSGGSLGSCVDEERSQLRELM